jgi:hypothetical protein
LCDRIEPYQSFGRNYQISLRVAIHLIADANAGRRRAAKVIAMRDLVADWKKWSAAERVLAAVAVTSAIMAVIVIGMVIV